MKPTIKQILIVSFSLFLFLFAWHLNNKKTKHKDVIEIDKSCEIVKINDSITYKTDPFKYKYKVVCFIEDSLMWELKDWMPFIKEYNAFPFVFYVKTDNKKYVIESLKKINFPMPVYIMPMKGERDYYRVLMIGYILNNNNEIMELANPLLPQFSTILKKYSSKNEILN